MFARVSRIQGTPQQLDDGIDYFRDARSPLRQMPGFKHAYLLVNRTSGEVVTITMWEREEDLQAGALLGQALRRQGANAAGAADDLWTEEIYEVALET